MKVALTGHSGAIGSEIVKLLGEENVIGFSRSTGHHIKDDMDEIIMLASECDVFINLANDGFASTELLINLYEDWQEEHKQIINVGSAIADYYDMRPELAQYAAEKAALKHVAKIFNHDASPCECKYVSFGYIDTPKMRKKYPEAYNLMSTEEAAKIICSLISNT